MPVGVLDLPCHRSRTWTHREPDWLMVCRLYWSRARCRAFFVYEEWPFGGFALVQTLARTTSAASGCVRHLLLFPLHGVQVAD